MLPSAVEMLAARPESGGSHRCPLGTRGSGTQSGPPGNVVRRADPGDWPPVCTVNGGAEVYYTSEEDSEPAQKEGDPGWETVWGAWPY